MIGDDEPHSTDYPLNVNKLDWKSELKALQGQKVKVFAMRCLRKNPFWQELANLAQTPLLELTVDFQGSMASLEAVAYAGSGEAAYASYARKGRVVNAMCCRADFASNASALKAFVDSEE